MVDESEPLPEGWYAQDDGQGNIYYYNEHTQESVWERPVAEDPTQKSLAIAVEPDTEYQWTQVWDSESQANYYHNEVTGETSWDRPEGFQEPPPTSPIGKKVSAAKVLQKQFRKQLAIKKVQSMKDDNSNDILNDSGELSENEVEEANVHEVEEKTQPERKKETEEKTQPEIKKEVKEIELKEEKTIIIEDDNDARKQLRGLLNSDDLLRLRRIQRWVRRKLKQKAEEFERVRREALDFEERMEIMQKEAEVRIMKEEKQKAKELAEFRLAERIRETSERNQMDAEEQLQLSKGDRFFGVEIWEAKEAARLKLKQERAFERMCRETMYREEMQQREVKMRHSMIMRMKEKNEELHREDMERLRMKWEEAEQTKYDRFWGFYREKILEEQARNDMAEEEAYSRKREEIEHIESLHEKWLKIDKERSKRMVDHKEQNTQYRKEDYLWDFLGSKHSRDVINFEFADHMPLPSSVSRSQIGFRLDNVFVYDRKENPSKIYHPLNRIQTKGRRKIPKCKQKSRDFDILPNMQKTVKSRWGIKPYIVDYMNHHNSYLLSSQMKSLTADASTMSLSVTDPTTHRPREGSFDYRPPNRKHLTTSQSQSQFLPTISKIKDKKRPATHHGGGQWIKKIVRTKTPSRKSKKGKQKRPHTTTPSSKSKLKRAQTSHKSSRSKSRRRPHTNQGRPQTKHSRTKPIPQPEPVVEVQEDRPFDFVSLFPKESDRLLLRTLFDMSVESSDSMEKLATEDHYDFNTIENQKLFTTKKLLERNARVNEEFVSLIESADSSLPIKAVYKDLLEGKAEFPDPFSVFFEDFATLLLEKTAL